MLLWAVLAVVFLLIPSEAADEDDVRAGTQHALVRARPASPRVGSLHRLQHGGQRPGVRGRWIVERRRS